MENRLWLKSKQREDRTDQEETTDASSHIRHSVAIPYPVPQKNLTVQVNKISIIVKQCFAAVRFILQWNRLFVCSPLCNIVTQCWCFDWQFAPSKLLFKFQFAAWANYFFPLWNRGNFACHRSQLTTFQYEKPFAQAANCNLNRNLLGANYQWKYQHCVTILQSGAQTNNRFHCKSGSLSHKWEQLINITFLLNIYFWPY